MKTTLMAKCRAIAICMYIGGGAIGAIAGDGPRRCADSWNSPSIGRSGACSHHGGVSGSTFYLNSISGPAEVVSGGGLALGFLLWAIEGITDRLQR